MPDEGTGGILVLLGLEGMSLIPAALQQCSLPSKDCGNSGLFIALLSQPGCPLPVLCHPSALLALGTLSSQLVLNLGWISPFSGIPKRRILTRSFSLQLHHPGMTTPG